MLFADAAVAALLNDQFECAWQSLRPVPKVHIDFGNGHTLDRTLNGNIAIWFVTAEGEAIDLVPGLIEPAAFQRRCMQAAQLHATLAALEGDPRPGLALVRHSIVREFHARRLQPAGTQVLGTAPAQAPSRSDIGKFNVEMPVKRAIAGSPFVPDPSLLAQGETEEGSFEGVAAAIPPAERVLDLSDLSKTRLEMPVKLAIAGNPSVLDPRSFIPFHEAGSSTQERGGVPGNPGVAGNGLPIELAGGSASPRIADRSKALIERPLKTSLHGATPQPGASVLPADTHYNQLQRDPQVARLMMDAAFASPLDLSSRVYREILGVELDDPYLGLAPYLLGGELGRDGQGLDH